MAEIPGTHTIDVPHADAIDEVIGHANVGGDVQTVRQSFVKLSEQLAGSGAVSEAIAAVEAVASAGIRWTEHIIEGRSTGNVDLATGLVNGATLNGLTVQTGKFYFIGLQTDLSKNGIYAGVAAGAAARATFADSEAELAYIGFVLQGGTVGAGERWTLPLAAADIVIEATALNFAPFGIEPGYSGEVEAGRGEYSSLGDRIGELPYSAPMLATYKEVTFDQNGYFISGKTIHGAEFGARGGAVAQLSETTVGAAPLLTYDGATDACIPARALISNKVYGVIALGQSHIGLSYDTGDATVTTAAQHAGYALMHNTGVFNRLNDTVYSWNSFVDLLETAIVSTSYETICSGMADAIMRRCNTSFGAKPKIIFSATVRGGTAYKDLRRGSNWYLDVLRTVARDWFLCNQLGQQYEVLCVVPEIGQQDYVDGTSRWEYARFMSHLQHDLDRDIRQITAQISPVRLYFSQSGYRSPQTIGGVNEPALGQMMAPKMNPMLRCAGAPYQSLGSEDDLGGHYKASGFYHIGLMLGHAIFDGEFGVDQKALEVVDCWWTSTSAIRLKFNMPIALETDDTVIKISDLGAGKGVDFLDGSVSPPTVSGIAVASSVYLDVTLSGASSGKNPRLYIACRASDAGSGNSGTGAITGNRSAIRAAASYDTAPLTGDVLYQRAVAQELVLGPA